MSFLKEKWGFRDGIAHLIILKLVLYKKKCFNFLLICLNVVVIQMNWALYTDERKGTGGIGGRWDEG